MKVKSRVSFQPEFYPRMFVGGVIVDDQVEIQLRGSLGVDLLEETDEFLMPMPRETIANDMAINHVECGEQR